MFSLLNITEKVSPSQSSSNVVEPLNQGIKSGPLSFLLLEQDLEKTKFLFYHNKLHK